MDNLASLADTAHNDTLADTEKDTTLQDFCATDCGKKYVRGRSGRVFCVSAGACGWEGFLFVKRHECDAVY